MANQYSQVFSCVLMQSKITVPIVLLEMATSSTVSQKSYADVVQAQMLQLLLIYQQMDAISTSFQLTMESMASSSTTTLSYKENVLMITH
jgi:hypothetical protein